MQFNSLKFRLIKRGSKMSGYIRSTKVVYDFDGESVRVSLKPILFADTLKFHQVNTLSDEGRMAECSKLFSEIVPKYIEEMDLKAKDGSQVTVEELCSVAYFTSLVIRIGSDLIRSGSPENPPNAGVQ